MIDRLRQWRLTKSKALGIPAFRILTDRALVAVATSKPRDLEELLAVPGIGAKIVSRYGRAILQVLNAH